MAKVIVEVCVDNAAGLEAAIEGGADRIELCSALSLGGLTPSVGLMRLAAQASVPVFAMIRPRGGGFLFGDREIEVMHADIDAAGQAGLAGVVLGASRRDKRLDTDLLAKLVARAAGMGTTLHRAIDLVPDLSEGVETAIAIGFDRVLTSGGKKTAVEGLEGLKAMHEISGGRLTVMAGSGISAANAAALLAEIPLSEIHASCSINEVVADPDLLSFGFSEDSERRTSSQSVAALKAVARQYA